MNTYNIFLLDDDTVFLSAFEDSLRRYLETLPYSFSVSAFNEAARLFEEAALRAPDLIIADIKLDGDERNGIDLMRALRENGCTASVIFLTGYIEYAPDIFGVQPIYFILKREYEKRIPEAIGAFLKATEKSAAALTVTIGKTFDVIPMDDIIYVERVLRRTIIHKKSGKLSVSAPLGDIAGRLSQRQFAFSHQSVVVNLKYVKSIAGAVVTMFNGEELPVSRSHSADFRRSMALYLEDAPG